MGYKSPNTKNYRRPKGHVLFDKDYSGKGYLHLGNVPEFTWNIEFETDPHYSSMSSSRLMDDEDTLETNVTGALTLEEFSAENVDLAFLGNGVSSGLQAEGYLDAQAVTTIAERYVDVGKKGLTYYKIHHAAPSGGSFSAGGTLTLDDGTTMTIVWADTTGNILYCVNASATPTTGQDGTDGTSTAAVTRADKVDGAIVTDAATPTALLVAGTDYDLIPDGAMIREITGGSIASNTAYVSADYPALAVDAVQALYNTECVGELKYIGTNDKGPKFQHTFYKVKMKVSGDLGNISEDRASIPIELTIYADTSRAKGDQYFSTEIIKPT